MSGMLEVAPDRMGCGNSHPRMGCGNGAPDRMGCGNVGGVTGPRILWECWRCHLQHSHTPSCQVPLAPDRMGCGNVGGGAHLTGWGVGMLEVAPPTGWGVGIPTPHPVRWGPMLEVAPPPTFPPDRMGCGNVGGGTPDRMGCGNVEVATSNIPTGWGVGMLEVTPPS